MIRRCILALTTCGFLAAGAGAATRVVLEQRGAAFWHKFVHISTNAPSSRIVEQLTAPVVRETSIGVRRVVVASELASLWDATHKYAMYDVGEEVILRRRRDAPRTGKYLLEVLCVAGDCIERSIDRHGRLQERVLSGSNPLVVEVDGRVASMVYVEVEPAGLPRVNFHGRVAGGSRQDATLLIGKLAARIRGLDVTLELRDDSRPFGSDRIPASFLLWSESDPPSMREYQARPFVSCGAWRESETMGCRTFTRGSSAEK